ncbi:acyl-CoA carboxylase subunit epsilon [Streptomyces bambusae]|uniref:acyl-CoA carboxylase subunit epsilon n=1 Tax=Streptomyces bambusae TaxID=1550616 RepID=UPI001CFF5156|nr:acyl-CoA carboxylase subunit epsilon [Streptomyces bambusae]MCB5165713.1 acyl-CoA carboxylase subunit epsilon [Streptomyces bambusae]
MTAAVPVPALVDDAAALALAASIRITKGNPTAEEVATLAVLLAARIRQREDADRAAARPGARIHRLPPRRRPPFVAPGSWAS